MFCTNGNPAKRRYVAGTSLIELLVVIVVFLVGILAIARIFPGGFKVLNRTRSNSQVVALTTSESNRVASRGSQLFEQILPIMMVNVASNEFDIRPDTTRSELDLSPLGPKIDGDGRVHDPNGKLLDYWAYASGPNTVRWVIAEGGQVPAPRAVGSYYGGLKILEFGPIDPHFVDKTNNRPVLVYSNDLAKLEGAPGQEPFQQYEYFVDGASSSDPQIYLPGSVDGATYRVSVNVYYVSGSGTSLLPVTQLVQVASGTASQFVQSSLDTDLGLTSANVRGIDFDSLRIARIFDQVAPNAFSTTNPYQYSLLDVRQGANPADFSGKLLGQLLFSPASYNYEEKFPDGRRLPLVARVDYIVNDWRILKEEFRIPSGAQSEYRLRLGNLAHTGNVGSDNRTYVSDPTKFPHVLNFAVNNEGNALEHRDVVLMDLQTGGVYSNSTFKVDFSIGLLTFYDPANAQIVYPGDAAPTTINAAGRSVRALYRANGEFAVQVLKAASYFTASQSGNLVNAEYYPEHYAEFLTSGKDFSDGEPASTRIIFPRMDIGKRVSIDEIWYYTGSGTSTQLECARGQDFLIDNDGHISLSTIDPQATSLAFKRYGFAVRGVKGASITFRGLWNSSNFRLIGDQNRTTDNFEEWGRNWHQSVTQTYIQGGAAE